MWRGSLLYEMLRLGPTSCLQERGESEGREKRGERREERGETRDEREKERKERLRPGPTSRLRPSVRARQTRAHARGP
jgi:hypothetical protein